ncbi:hypothetical protein [Streptomyces sp. NPDC046832]|uniref:hypothetical protein n=1 Tax=Streptomyces sp. NPDC046832 TaxID=3155020 RepID=UPI00340E06F0
MIAVEPTDWRRMLSRTKPCSWQWQFSPPASAMTSRLSPIDTERVRENNGLLIVPYNSVQYLASRDVREQLLDCWPILVGLERGDVRFEILEQRHLWKNPSTLTRLWQSAKAVTGQPQ